MIVLITGGRNYTNTAQLTRVLDHLNAHTPFTALLEGGCPTGADKMAAWWAGGEADVSVETYHAAWDELGKAAGPVRNRRMVREGKPDLVVAFDGGAGTANCVKEAREAGVKVIAVPPE